MRARGRRSHHLIGRWEHSSTPGTTDSPATNGPEVLTGAGLHFHRPCETPKQKFRQSALDNRGKTTRCKGTQTVRRKSSHWTSISTERTQ